MTPTSNAPDDPPRKPEVEVPVPMPEKEPADPQTVPPPAPDVIFPGGGEPLGIPTGPGPEIPSTPAPPEI